MGVVREDHVAVRVSVVHEDDAGVVREGVVHEDAAALVVIQRGNAQHHTSQHCNYH